MSWQAAILCLLALVLVVGGVWFERSRPSARIVAAVAALAALGAAGRVLLAPMPNLVATTDVALLAGYVLGGPAGFAAGALSALVSNFWLGQGPWTPWQMAGWGMVGVGGAALAKLSGRRLGRIGLAAAAGLAGLAYGALLDLSVMVNFGGEQSLDRYLALSARAIPFNLVHAAGNAAIMLAAGPALVRMLDRYRGRFEVSWRDLPRPGPAAAAGLLALALALPLLTGAAERARAGEESPRAQASGVKGAVGWLRAAQNRDGGYGTSRGSSSNTGMTGWAMLGLEAAGRNPRDVRKGGSSPVEYLRKNIGRVDSTGDLERTILALRGAGISASGFGGRDLVAELRSRQGSNGSYGKQVNLTAFAILARAAAGEGSGSLRKPAAWLKDAQNRDGGWGSTPTAPSEPDSTGAVLQALARSGEGKVVDRAVRWLKRAQHRDGGWSLNRGADPNSQSTAWAVQGLAAAGADPAGVRKGKRSGLDFLAARQAGDGHYAYSKASDQTPVWVTAQALTGIERQPFPIAAVAREPRQAADGGGEGGSGSSAGAGGTSPGGSGGGSAGGLGAGANGSSRSGPGANGSDRGGPGSATGGGSGGHGSTARPGAVPGIAEAAPGEPATASPGDEQDEGASPLLVLAGVNLLAALALGGWLLYREGYRPAWPRLPRVPGRVR